MVTPNIETRTRKRGLAQATAALSVIALISGLGLHTSLAQADTNDMGSALILADTNRDGVITAADAPGRDAWSQTRGALYLANLDDDDSRCPKVAPDGSQLSDVELASCNDAADLVINSDRDTLDLAPVRVAGVDTNKVSSVRVEVRGAGSSKVNVFIKNGTGAHAADWTLLPASGVLPADRIADGIELGIEGKDIIRDESWDGSVDLMVVHRNGQRKVASDQIRLRVAPLLFATDRMPIETLYMADNETSVYEGATLPEPTASLLRTRQTAAAMAADFLEGMEKMDADVELETLPSLQGARGGGDGTDIWTQDIMEPGLMSIPSVNGEQQIRVFVRAPVRDGRDNSGDNPFRQTGRVVFTELRGPDVAGIQHFDPSYVPPSIPGMSYDSRGSTGNYGTVPAYEYNGKRYPLGRKIYGAVAGTEYTADPAFNKMLDLQGFQDPIAVDTSWLNVGHIDEFMSVIPANNARGWALVVADPQLALNLLKELVADGRGDEQLYTQYDAQNPESVTPPAMTVGEAVTDPLITNGVAIGHAGVSRALKVLREEIGLTDADIIRVPVLYREGAAGRGRVGVQVPNASNLIGTGHNVVYIPTQHVPAVDGKDLFQSVIEDRFAEIGTTVQWAEDYFYTNRGGQIHCVTNALRDTTYGESWWTEGPSLPDVQGDKAFSVVSQPSVTGVLQAGKTVTVHRGSISPAPSSVQYQWYRGSTAIPGATGNQLLLQSSWAGQTIRVSITSVKPGYTTLTTMTTLGAVPRSFKQTKKPRVTGVKKIGKALKLKVGSLSPKASSLNYRWYVGNKPVAGATNKKFKLTKKKWAGKSVKVVITAKKAGYTTLKTTVKVGKVRR